MFNGSPLFTGDAGGGESEIRKWIIENDWLDTIVMLPNELFYNTGIYTYIWLLRKPGSPCVAVVDPGDADAVDAALQRDGLTLTSILLTCSRLDRVPAGGERRVDSFQQQIFLGGVHYA